MIMEIKVNIPKNDYVQPTEVRQEVVQGICEAFLGDCAWSMFHPFTNGRYAFKKPTLNILKHKGEKAFYGFYYKKPFADDEMVTFNGAEMKVAFRALRDAGYHIFWTCGYEDWMGYKCSKKPFMEKGTEVFDFTDFID